MFPKLPNHFQTKSQNVCKMFTKCPKILPEQSQNFSNNSKKNEKNTKVVQILSKTIKNQLKNTSGRSSSEVFFNFLHPVHGPGPRTGGAVTGPSKGFDKETKICP